MLETNGSNLKAKEESSQTTRIRPDVNYLTEAQKRNHHQEDSEKIL